MSKNIGHPTLGSGGKNTFKRYLKSEQTDRRTDRRTDRQTDISTYRKHRPRGPCICLVMNTAGKRTTLLERPPLHLPVKSVATQHSGTVQGCDKTWAGFMNMFASVTQ